MSRKEKQKQELLQSDNLRWVGYSENSKVSEESLWDWRDVGGGVRVHCRHVCDILHIAPGVGILVVESAVIDVFTDQLYGRLVSPLVNLEK